MPGILPMKVIKVGSNAQSRIAQACDRCRSKKIRCDGIRPTCSQCATVGFECKTSDKLSRRAFPRGYTESLEERVRSLEQEVRELKELLDEKDEKIDMLTRIHSQSPHVLDMSNTRRRSSTPHVAKEVDDAATKDDVFKVQQSPHLECEGASSYFSGSSSTRMFLEAFKRKVQETGRSTSDIDVDRLLDCNSSNVDETSEKEDAVVWKTPPRLVSDQLINIFFQEWAPLFPILYRPTFLALYEKYVADSDSVTDKAEIAQLNLVFGIAALSNNGMRSLEDLPAFELQWKESIDAVLKENSMATLQALLLAQIFCILKDDSQSLLIYKGLSMTLSARLGLHHSQKRFALGTLTCETRKKVFWTLYTVDCFTAVTLGMPKQLKDEDIQCEYPVDADDEYVTDRGFTPTLPGESTKLSSALALFRATRILSKVLEEVFPAKASYDLSLKKLAEFSDELENWSTSLAPHLRLQFAQDKPSTGTITSRSPILSLMYHYIRALIQRPVICASLGSRSSSAMISMASSCKHMIQIIQLLDERGMSFSFCLNRDEVVVLSGFGILFQGINLDANSKILKDNAKMINAVIGLLDKTTAPCASEFKRVARSFIPEGAESPRKESTPKQKPPTLTRHTSNGTAPAVITSSSPTSSARKNLKAIASRFTSNGSPKKGSLDSADHRRASVHNISLHPQGIASQSVPALRPPSQQDYNPAATSRSEPARSPVDLFSRPSSTTTQPNKTPQQQHQPLKPRPCSNTQTLTNLDYLSFGNEPDTQARTTSRNSKPVKPEPRPTDWERLIGDLETTDHTVYDAYYNHSSLHNLFDMPSLGLQHTNYSAQAVNDISFSQDLWAPIQTDTTGCSDSILTTSSGHPSSVLSFTTDERDLNSSTEDFTSADWTTATTADSYRGICMPEWGHEDLSSGVSWETSLNL